jgi:nitrite reductase/ring-hydroxylating ferredoxin subunit
MPANYRICQSTELGENSKRIFKVGGIEFVAGRKDGKLFAFDNSCPHRGASLAMGEIHDHTIVCYMHGYEYDIFTGNLVNMKSWKKEDTWVEQSPAWRASGNLILLPIFESDGYVYVELNNNS